MRLSRCLTQYTGRRLDLDVEFERGHRVVGFRVVVLPGRDKALTRLCTNLPRSGVWRGGPSVRGPSPLVIITAGGTRQLIARTDQAVVSFDPATGKKHWEQPFRTLMIGDSVSAPVTIRTIHLTGFSRPWLTE